MRKAALVLAMSCAFFIGRATAVSPLAAQAMGDEVLKKLDAMGNILIIVIQERNAALDGWTACHQDTGRSIETKKLEEIQKLEKQRQAIKNANP